MTIFKDRGDAGRQLSEQLMRYQNQPDTLVLGLPRGGVPVAWEVAKNLKLPFDVFLVRKIGVPGQEELAMGAIASGGLKVLNQPLINRLMVPQEAVEGILQREMEELKRREQVYRDERPYPLLKDKTIILIDDGLATGASMLAAVHAVRQQKPAQIVVAVPTAASEICEAFRSEVEQVICLEMPSPFVGVGMWYADFSQVSDEEVRQTLLEAAKRQLPQP
jgi:putative phosphoribosyl transferase